MGGQVHSGQPLSYVPVELHIYRRGSHVDLLWTHPDSARSLGAFFVRTLEAAL